MRPQVMDSECVAVQLKPFVHQVGGSSSVLCFDSHTICKPLISREHHFYETMPPEMKEFTPEYRGLVEVRFQEDTQGYMNLVAHPITKDAVEQAVYSSSSLSSTDAVHSDSEQPASKHRFRLKRSGSIEIETDAEGLFEKVNPLSSEHDSATFCYNPWSLRCHRLQLAKMRKADNSEPPKFILLENLASHFKLPCILDLKMGTQQHGDDSSEEKRRWHTAKCQKSTSSSLGVRICGMQVYQANTGKFVCHDKYYGRQLTVQGFHQTLYQFLHNGISLRTDILDCMVGRIEQLRQVLQDQDTFRFYSSSLLIMYDGSVAPLQTRDTYTNTESYCDHPAVTPQVYHTESSRDAAAEPSTLHLAAHSPQYTQRQVDVRMIDFAHATHKNFCREDNLHHGPDRGYLFGLDSLIKVFCKLRDTDKEAA